MSRGNIEGATPVPIPNTEVKPFRADGTSRETGGESRTPRDFFLSAGADKSRCHGAARKGAVMINANALKKGNVIRHDGELCLVADLQHVKPGKGPAYLQTSLRNFRTGRSFQLRLGSSDSVELVALIRRPLQYSYYDGSFYVFLDPKNFDQFELPPEMIAEARDYLVEGSDYDILFCEDRPVQIELPSSVNLKVVEAPDWVKGDSATNVRKPVVLETGLSVNAPLFIQEGEIIKVDTRTGEYLGRA